MKMFSIVLIKRITSHWRRSFALPVFIGIIQISIAQDLLLQPSRFNEYHSQQILSDSTIRFFGLVEQRDGFFSGFSFFKDYNLYKSDHTPVWNFVGPYLNFTYGVTDLNVLSMREGSTIVGLSIFECDYSPPGGIIKIGKDQSIEWFIDFRDFDLEGGVQHMVFTNSAMAVFLGGWGYIDDTILISYEGELIDEDFQGEVYEFTIETDFGFLASKGNQLELLNSGFSVFESYTLEEIDTLQQLSLNQYLVQTNDKYYLLDEDLTLQSLSISPVTYASIWIAEGNYYAYQHVLHQVHVFDSLYNLLGSYPVLNGYSPKAGYHVDTMMVTTGTYFNGLNSWTYLQQSSIENLNFDRSLDIGITNIEIADTILVEYYALAFAESGWYRHYDFINVEVSNFTNDTIFHYIIENDVVTNCYWCEYEYKTWEIYDQPIPPHSAVHVELGPYLQRCTSEKPKDICLRTILPENEVDANHANDKYCQPYSITIFTEDASFQANNAIHPNPAQDEIMIFTDDGIIEEISIYSSSGILIRHYEDHQSGLALSINNLVPGIYFIKVQKEDLISSFHKLVKQ